MNETKAPPVPGAVPHTAQRRDSVRGPVYASTKLFQGERLLWIEHGDERYALRITRQGKLILTK